MLAGLARAVGPALLTWAVLDGGVAGWGALALLFALVGLLVPTLTRRALAGGAGQATKDVPAPAPRAAARRRAAGRH
ncbi:hypothetical protein [Micromonospora sp. 4G55]|uniref:hypothetical protein n=1 Tax=Micromonospora sp. 4G55 TaxID=2806102 RepID=UPI001A48A86B|nr:hypothetical protein [Micromonospora sp. 4G55]MBM0258685.1 hypothetical protein [Micromonospora sp. 4G55]